MCDKLCSTVICSFCSFSLLIIEFTRYKIKTGIYKKKNYAYIIIIYIIKLYIKKLKKAKKLIIYWSLEEI